MPHILHNFVHIERTKGRDGSALQSEDNSMKLQVLAIILQLVTVAALCANIVHHWEPLNGRPLETGAAIQ